MTACSDKALAAKLGLKAGLRVLLIDAPPEFPAWFGTPPGLVFLNPDSPKSEVDILFIFAKQKASLTGNLCDINKVLNPGGMLWICWPKKAAKQATDITENVVREVVLKTGWVDVKVCYVSEVWSGLKFLRRKSASKEQ